MNIKEAVCATRFHSQWLPDLIQYEPKGLVKDVKVNLLSKGHKLAKKDYFIGEANGIMITQNGYFGGGDCRGETAAIGY